MVFGDGDGELFNRFTVSLDVIGHELTHGVTEDEARLAYFGQSGRAERVASPTCSARWSSSSALNQTADQADWLIGAGLLTSHVNGVALRSMKAPGTAYDDPVLGKDPQPAHMKDFVHTDRGQRRRAHQLRHPEPRLLPRGDRRSAATPGRRRDASGTRRCATRACGRTPASRASPG